MDGLKDVCDVRVYTYVSVQAIYSVRYSFDSTVEQ